MPIYPTPDPYTVGFAIIPLIYLVFTRHKTVFMLYMVWGSLFLGASSVAACCVYWPIFEIFSLITDFLDGWRSYES